MEASFMSGFTGTFTTEKQKPLAAALFILMVFLGSGAARADYNYTTLNVPGASGIITVGIDANDFAGTFTD
jgi:hypothetical protein